MADNKAAAPATEAPKVEAPNGEGKKKQRLPQIDKSFDTLEQVNAAQTDAKAKGHTYDTRKFKVVANGKTAFALGFSPANAVGNVHEKLGIQVEEIDPAPSTGNKLTPESVKSRLSEEDKALLLKMLQEEAKQPKKK